MRITEDDTYRDLREAVRAMVERTVAPVVEKHIEDGPLSGSDMRELFHELGMTGLFGARAPDQYSSGLPLTLTGAVMEEMPAFLGVAAVAQEATIFRIGQSGDEALIHKYLPELIDGRLIAGSAISEPGVGSASNDVTTKFTISGNVCQIVGAKLWITNATIADVIVVVGRDVRTDSVVRALIDTRSTPVRARNLPMSGLRLGHLCEVELDVEIPAENVFVDGGDNGAAMTASWTLNRASMGLIACSVAEQAINEAIRYSKERFQFGKPIAGHQLVQALLADAATTVQAGRLLCYSALSLMEQGENAVTASSMAKSFATESALQAVIKCQQVAGAAGVSNEYPYSRMLNDVRMLTIPDGTTQIQQLIIGRQLTGISAFR